MSRLVVLGTTTIAAASLLSAPVAVGQQTQVQPRAASHTQRVSVGSAEQQGNNISGRSSRPAISGGDDIIAFDSIASNLVRGDTNDADDVFVRDRASGKTARVSVSSSGEQGNDDSSRPDLSGDGQLVVFDSSAANLVDGDTNARPDVFLHNRASGRTTLLSRGYDGRPADDASFSPTISADGRFVAFMSNATNLTRKPAAGAVFLYNVRTGRTSVVSVRLDGTAASAASPSLSAHAEYVAFSSFSAGIVPVDTNDRFDVFVRDRRTGETTCASVASAGAQAEGGDSTRPSLNADGTVVAFVSEATNLVRHDDNGERDIFVRILSSARTERVSISSSSGEADGPSDGPGIRGGSSFGPDISANGRYVTFDSIATNLVAGDTNTCMFTGGPSFPEPGQCPDVVLRDRRLNSTTRVSVTSSGAQANDASTDPAISSDGRSVVFFSAASDFTSRDTDTCPPFFFGHPGQCPDIYLHSTR